MKPFTTLAAIVFAIMALVHVYRLVRPFEIIVAGHPVAQWVSIVALIVTGVLAAMLWREARTIT